MPVYEYRCDHCSHYFTEQHKIADRKKPEVDPCPSCGRVAVKQKILSGIAVVDPYVAGRVRPGHEFSQRIDEIKKNSDPRNIGKRTM